MTRRAPTLRELVLNRLAELGTERGPLSYRDAAAKSGGLVSAPTLHLIGQGTHNGDITDRVLKGVARAIEMPLAEVVEAANRSKFRPPVTLPPRSADLNQRERRALIAVMDAFLAGRQ